MKKAILFENKVRLVGFEDSLQNCINDFDLDWAIDIMPKDNGEYVISYKISKELFLECPAWGTGEVSRIAIDNEFHRQGISRFVEMDENILREFLVDNYNYNEENIWEFCSDIDEIELDYVKLVS